MLSLFCWHLTTIFRILNQLSSVFSCSPTIIILFFPFSFTTLLRFIFHSLIPYFTFTYRLFSLLIVFDHFSYCLTHPVKFGPEDIHSFLLFWHFLFMYLWHKFYCLVFLHLVFNIFQYEVVRHMLDLRPWEFVSTLPITTTITLAGKLSCFFLTYCSPLYCLTQIC